MSRIGLVETFLISGMLAWPAMAGSHLAVKANAAASGPAGHDYISALATANRFLQAWQMRDQETGILLLTDAGKRRSSIDKFGVFFSGPARPAYEIARGRKIKSGRYIFPVRLWEAPAAETHLRDSPRSVRLLVVRTGKDDWAIDRLP